MMSSTLTRQRPEEGRVGDVDVSRGAVGTGVVLDAPLCHNLVRGRCEDLELFGRKKAVSVSLRPSANMTGENHSPS